jgi:hypothetical protein
MKQLLWFVLGFFIALNGSAFAQRGMLFDPAANNFDSILDTEVTKPLSDLLPDSHYQPSWNFHTFQDSQTGISGSLFLIALIDEIAELC